jgi:uncharacterized protein
VVGILRELNAIFSRVKNGLQTWPDGASWGESLAIFALYGVCAWGFGFTTGLYEFAPHLNSDLVRVAILAFFVPAIGEEVFFRAALIPTSIEKPQARLNMALALIIFLAWHPLNAWLFFKDVLPLFTDWRFLAVTAMLGLACTHLWRKTGSLWPPVFLHWIAVVVWKGLLGGPAMI